MHKVIVIGGGAAGMMAAYASANQGNQVVLIEKNEKLGKKVYITGKGRCNLTNNCDNKEFIENVVSNSKFMFGAINAFSTQNVMDFFEQNGLQLKTERGNRVFPLSDKASDVTNCLQKLLIKQGVEICLNSQVDNILKNDEGFNVYLSNKKRYISDSVIICTGGISYSATGSTGDGYKFAKFFGHQIIETKPSLVGININNDFCRKLQGISLKNVVFSAKINGKTIFSQLGEMLFAHYGISGPLVLSCSALINRSNLENVCLNIDLKSGMTYEMLDNRLIREFEIANQKGVIYAIKTLLPMSFAEVILSRCSISKEKKCNEVTQKERERIIKTLKEFSLSASSLRPIEEAIITAGGVNVKEINPKTMESKLVSGLYFAGEVLDVDCFTGGFNMQTAFSTGYVAGVNS